MMKYTRKKTKKIKVGNITIGGGSPVVVQSMTNTPTKNINSTIRQIKQLEYSGCELIRCSVPDIESANAISKIKNKINIPIVSDIHFDYKLAILASINGADKIRINPGNMNKKEIKELVQVCKDNNTVVRIGVNSGSLKSLHNVRGRNIIIKKAELMVNKVLDYLNVFEKLNYHNIIVSLKSTDVLITKEACIKFANTTNYPLHLGITEAGSLFSGTIKSGVGLGMILGLGLGDTVRVSLADNPIWEVRAAYNILSTLGLRFRVPEVIACPTCARTEFDVINMTRQIEKLIYKLDFRGNFTNKLKIAIMGCVVNGIGEARECDLGITGAGNKICMFKNGRIIKKIKKDELENLFSKEIKKIIYQTK